MTLLIKNVRVLGGSQPTGSPGGGSETTDVFVNGDKISAIGSFPGKKADTIVDGGGAYLSPGFIDVNTDSDHYLSIFDYPQQTDFLAQGVTTIIGGMCGSSLAPLLYGSLESVQKWGDISKTNVNWHSVKEFLEHFEKKPLAVNFATLIGHATVRRAIAGGELRELTKNELAVFESTLKRALEEGGFGLSTGLGYVHGYRTPYSELKRLAKIVKDAGGVYATHLRKSNSEISEAVEETIKLAKETGVKTTISHFMPIVGSETAYETALERIESLPREMDFNFDVYPYDTNMLAIYTFLPLWVQSGGRQVMLANLRDPWMRPRIERDIADLNPADFIVAQAPGNDFLVGKSLKDLCRIYNIPDYRGALVKLMMTTELRGIIFYKNISKKLVDRILKSPRSFIASNAASFNDSGKNKMLKPERAVSTFTKFLSLVESDRLMPIEEAIKKITFEPARKFGLTNHGLIKEGNFANLTIFKEAKIKYVIVNGSLVFGDDGFAGEFPGRALRHNA